MPKVRQGVPAGWTWRDGRPRWIPGPGLRKAGWRGKDLQDGRKAWLGRGPSIAAADAICQAVELWRGRQPVPADFADIAPEGACGPAVAAELDAFSIGALIDDYLKSKELLFRRDGTPRPEKTVSDYSRKLKRLVDALAGYARLPDPKDKAELADHAAKTAQVRAMPVFALEPEEAAGGLNDPLHAAYWKLHEHAGVHAAFGVLACASAWLTWCRRRKSRRIVNWAADVGRETPPGRIRPWTFPELAAMVAAADKLAAAAATQQERLCYLGTADAFVLAIDLSWSGVDVLALTKDRIAIEGGRKVALGARQKTGRVGGTPFLSMGRRRLDAIDARHATLDVTPLQVIYLPRKKKHRGRTKAEAQGDYMRDWFEKIRAEAAKALPSCATLTFADTRDTGFSLGKQAGLTDDGIASRSRQSRANVKSLGDRAYGEIGPEIAGPAADQLDAYLEAQLKKHRVKL